MASNNAQNQEESNKNVTNSSKKQSDDKSDKDSHNITQQFKSSVTDLSKSDLIKLLCCLESELQAKDIFISVLKSDKLKNVANIGKYHPTVVNDPYMALLRDYSFEENSSEKSDKESIYCDKELTSLAFNQKEALDNLMKHNQLLRNHIQNLMNDFENRYLKLLNDFQLFKTQRQIEQRVLNNPSIKDLEEQKRLLEKELETERQYRKKYEKDLQAQIDLFNDEMIRRKEMVTYLMNERKDLWFLYVQEQKFRQDLNMILNEEKLRTDSIAQDLEEESKKALKMEAELEKQTIHFEQDRKNLLNALNFEKNRSMDLEAELKKCKSELDSLKLQLSQKGSQKMSLCNTTNPEDENIAIAMTSSNVAKVVQPTATVSSVPVSAPTIGIAQSISTGQVLKNPINTVSNLKPTSITSPSATMVLRKNSNINRNTPPPVPPNKPIIVKKDLIVSKKLDVCDNDKKNISLTTNVIAGSSSNVSNTKDTAQKNIKDQTKTNNSTSEVLGQELVDFQNILVTMATNNLTS